VKNVQVIDGAANSEYAIFALTDEEFSVIFPDPGQDIEFIEDVIKRVGDKKLGLIMKPVWDRRVSKAEVRGIHGTLFYERAFKKKFYPTKRESEMLT